VVMGRILAFSTDLRHPHNNTRTTMRVCDVTIVKTGVVQISSNYGGDCRSYSNECIDNIFNVAIGEQRA